MARVNIAIDGPAGAGKSTVARSISKTMGIIYLDTGAMYRTVALKALNSGLDTKNEESIASLVEDIDIKIRYRDGEQRIFLDGKDVSELIRTPGVSRGASDVSAIPAVRIKLVELQRSIAEENDVVMDGRDIGTYVLPNARYKFFLTASLEERAKRRYNELLAKGMEDSTLDEVMKDISYRDKNDSSRAFAPLSKAEDAVEIDTTGMNRQEVVEKVLSYLNKYTDGADE